MSGGHDSPVAGHRAMRPGLACDFVHFSGAPYTNASSVYKAYALARELNRYQPPGRLHVIALGKAQKPGPDGSRPSPSARWRPAPPRHWPRGPVPKPW
ncbi:hypothetical protein [Streptomyces clavuligerus]|uniref:hypothetical protein n=1 Tax=Streptomyces clavuligerus TaxID=1901 RepID=UPI0027DC1598|nr:hypothetical protein [Streptomyces clavuligerus]